MFNHARSLLMNMSGSGSYVPGFPGEELIPAEYREVKLPTYLNIIRLRLFGAAPDRVMLNYRVAQLLQLVASTELQSHVLALDSRLTYGEPQGLSDASAFQPQVRQFRGTTQLSILGEPIAPDSGGQVYYDYQVLTAEGTVTINRLVFPAITVSEPVIITRGLSQEISLPYSGYRFRLNAVTPAGWTIRGCLRPQLPLSEIAQGLRSVGEPHLLQLFGVSNEEPYLTFRNCWNNHPEFAYRFGGLILALIYRTEEVRNGQS